MLANSSKEANAVALAALAAVEKEDDLIRRLSLLIRLTEIFEKTGDTDRSKQIDATANAVFEQVNGVIRSGSDLYLGYVPDLVAALVDTGQLDLAAAVAEKWAGSGWENVGCLAGVANAYLNAGSSQQATSMVDKLASVLQDLATSEEYSFERDKRVASLGCAAEVLVRTGRQEEAMQLAGSRSDTETKSHVLGCSALALANGGHIEDARRLAEASLAASQELPSSGHELSLWWASAARALKAVGRGVQATTKAANAVALSEAWGTEEWRRESDLLVLVNTLVEVGRREGACALTERLTHTTEKAEALVQLISAYPDDPDRARTFANRAAEMAREITDMNRVDVLGSAALELAIAGFDVEASDFAQLAVAAVAEVRDLNRGPEDGLSKAAEALAHVGKFNEAEKVAQRIFSLSQEGNSIRTLSVGNRALVTLVQKLEQSGRHAEAVVTARRVLDTAMEVSRDAEDIFNWDAMDLILAAKACRAVGDSENAVVAASRAFESALAKMNRLGDGLWK